MPQRVVTLKRWHVFAAFFAVTVAFVVGLFKVTDLIGQNENSIRRLRSFDARQRTVELGVCALREDLRKRVREGETFLRKHPGGAFGFTAAEIKTSLENERRTVGALAGVICPPVP